MKMGHLQWLKLGNHFLCLLGSHFFVTNLPFFYFSTANSAVSIWLSLILSFFTLSFVLQGPCEPTCQGLQLGMFSGFGFVRASNRGICEYNLWTCQYFDFFIGFCNHDFFRCCKGAKKLGLDKTTVRDCCKQRWRFMTNKILILMKYFQVHPMQSVCWE